MSNSIPFGPKCQTLSVLFALLYKKRLWEYDETTNHTNGGNRHGCHGTRNTLVTEPLF